MMRAFRLAPNELIATWGLFAKEMLRVREAKSQCLQGTCRAYLIGAHHIHVTSLANRISDFRARQGQARRIHQQGREPLPTINSNL